MRLFTGIALSPAVIEKISAALTELGPTVRVNWSPIENLHITARFIGAWPEERFNDLKIALNSVPQTGPIPIHIARFGFFPNPHHPHSFFAAVEAAPALTALVAAMNDALFPLGLPAESRPYHPHVTLARIKPPADIRTLREHIAQMTNPDFGAFEVTEFHLYESTPTARGSVYEKLATYDLMREKSTTQ